MPSPADDLKKSWRGELVVPTVHPEQIKFGDNAAGQPVYYEFSGLGPFSVREDKDGWLRLFDGYKEGWADKDQFVVSRDATAYFTARIDADPKDSWLWVVRGTAWSDQGKYDNAVRDFTEAIRLAPEYAMAFNNRGNAWSDQGKHDEAIKDFNEAIRLNPKFALAFNSRGATWDDKGEYDNAIKDFTEAIRLDPKYAIPFNRRGCALDAKGEHDRAIRDYDEAVRLDPKYVLAFYNRGNAWAAKLEHDRAIRDYDEAVRLDPKFAFGFQNRGREWWQKGEYDKAIQNFDEAIRLDPKYDIALISRAWLRATCPVEKYRDGKQAVADAKKACELAPKQTSHMNVLAAAYAEAGQFDKAVEMQKKTLDDPEYEKTYGYVSMRRLWLFEAKKPYRDVSK